MEVEKFKYRRMFGMTAQQMEDEPIDQFFINLFIYAQIEKKKEAIEKHGPG